MVPDAVKVSAEDGRRVEVRQQDTDSACCMFDSPGGGGDGVSRGVYGQ
jgi:hypothetical protein